MARSIHIRLALLGICLSAVMSLNACQCLVVIPFAKFQPYKPGTDAGEKNDRPPIDIGVVDVVNPDAPHFDAPPTDAPSDGPLTPDADAGIDAGPDGPQTPDEPISTPDEPSSTPDEPTVPEEPAVGEEPIPEIPCNNGEIRSCNTAKLGVCKAGEQRCVNGEWSKCESLLLPTAEICDGLDNDCDGTIDFIRRDCPYSGPAQALKHKPCRVGSQLCIAGQWSNCTGEVTPKPEICNNKDDDCDGSIDEWLPIQSRGAPTLVSNKGYEAHLYMVATQTGYALGWSEQGSQKVFLTRLRADAKISGPHVQVTKTGELGNIHGLSYDGKRFIVSWDTDQGGQGGDALYAVVDEKTGQRLINPTLLAKGGRMVNPQVAFGFNYIGVTWSDFGNNRIYVQTFDLNLKPLSTAQYFSLSTQNSPYPGMSFSLDRMGVTWNTQQGKLQFAVFDKNRKQIGTTTDIPNAGTLPNNATVAGDLSGFLVVWADQTNGKLLGQRLDRSGKVVGAQAVIAASGAQTPIMQPTSYGGIIAWVQKSGNLDGVAIGRVDRTGKLLAKHSWFAVPGVVPYLALAWSDGGQGKGRGALGWLDNNGALRVAPLGCK